MKNHKQDETLSLIEVDKDRLDEEWTAQPRRYYIFAKKLADAKQELAEAKAELKMVEAEISMAIRNDPGEYGLEKLTEPLIAAAILLQDTYKDSQRGYISAEHKVDVMEAAVSALDHKKKALESLVYLHNSAYYAAPHAPKAEKERLGKLERDAAFGSNKERKRQ